MSRREHFDSGHVESVNGEDTSRFGGYRHRDWFSDDQPYEVKKVPVAPLAEQADKTESFLREMEGRKRPAAGSTANIRELAGRYKAGEDVGRMVVHEDEAGKLDLLDGHHRARAAKKAGLSEVEVYVNRGARRRR